MDHGCLATTLAISVVGLHTYLCSVCLPSHAEHMLGFKWANQLNMSFLIAHRTFGKSSVAETASRFEEPLGSLEILYVLLTSATWGPGTKMCTTQTTADRKACLVVAYFVISSSWGFKMIFDFLHKIKNNLTDQLIPCNGLLAFQID